MGATRLILLASAAQTATANGAAFQVPNLKELAVIVDVTAATAPTLLTVYLQGSADGGTTFTDLTAECVIQNLAGATSGTVTGPNIRNLYSSSAATGRSHGKYAIFYDTVRIAWVITGTSFTFSVRAVGK